MFAENGYFPVQPGWPDDPETVEEANARPPRCSRTSPSARSPTTTPIVRELDRKPAVIGHSFGGLLTMIVAGRGVAGASVAIDSAPFRGVLPLPFSALKASSPVLGNPLNRHRAITLTYDRFYDTFAVPASPPAINEAAFTLQQKKPGVTEVVSIENRGHSITIDSGWREVCDTAVAFIRRFA